MKRMIGLLCVAFALAGCAQSSMVMVGDKHPPLDPSQVRVYASPPSHPFDQIAVLDALGAGLGPQAQMDSAVNKLKAEAAKLGANGILLQGVSGAHPTAAFGTAYGSNGTFATGSAFGVKRAEASATAIYVQNP